MKKPTSSLKPFTDNSGGSLFVNPELDLAKYAEEKKEKSMKAIETWDAVDGSTRFRMSVPLMASIPGAD